MAEVAPQSPRPLEEFMNPEPPLPVTNSNEHSTTQDDANSDVKIEDEAEVLKCVDQDEIPEENVADKCESSVCEDTTLQEKDDTIQGFEVVEEDNTEDVSSTDDMETGSSMETEVELTVSATVVQASATSESKHHTNDVLDNLSSKDEEDASDETNSVQPVNKSECDEPATKDFDVDGDEITTLTNVIAETAEPIVQPSILGESEINTNDIVSTDNDAPQQPVDVGEQSLDHSKCSTPPPTVSIKTESTSSHIEPISSTTSDEVVSVPDSMHDTVSSTSSDRALVEPPPPPPPIVESISRDDESVASSEATELKVTSSPTESADGVSSNRRGRRTQFGVPLHVLGRDISKPVESSPNGNRNVPKPRLGVKVPYRNLASQIVSKQEIEKEIMQRMKEKHDQVSVGKDNMLFARQLTHRLASKLMPNSTNSITKPNVEANLRKIGETASEIKISQSPTIIKNNSDLIAILEGDNDPDTTPRHIVDVINQEKKMKASASGDGVSVVKSTVVNVNRPQDVDNLRNTLTEREIALEQLRVLPFIKPDAAPKRNRFFKSRNSSSSDSPKPEKFAAEEKINIVPSSSDSSSAKSTPVVSKSTKQLSTKTNDTIDPILKAEMVLKTYARKRSSLNMPISVPRKLLKTNIQSSNDTKDTPVNKVQESTKSALSSKGNPIVKIASSDIITSSTNDKAIVARDAHSAKDTSTTNVSPSVKNAASIKGNSASAKNTPSIKNLTSNRNTPSAKNTSVAGTTLASKNTPAKRAQSDGPDHYVTKSSRVIKKKVIWDPAQSASPRRKMNVVHPPTPRIIRKSTPMRLKTSTGKLSVKSGPTRRRHLTEVDKLLQDEGAINMLMDISSKSEDLKSGNDLSEDDDNMSLVRKAKILKQDLKQTSVKSAAQKSLRQKRESASLSPGDGRKSNNDHPLITITLPRSDLCGLASGEGVAKKKAIRTLTVTSNTSSMTPPSSPAPPTGTNNNNNHMRRYSNAADASRIIRRHSSSSFSSVGGDGATSDGEGWTVTSMNTQKRRKAQANSTARVPVKRVRENDMITTLAATGRISNTPSSKSKQPSSNGLPVQSYEDVYKNFINEDITDSKLLDKRFLHFSGFRTTSIDTMVHIQFNSKSNYYLTSQVLKDLTSCLNELATDDTCLVVCLTSNSRNVFCHGINYKQLIADSVRSDSDSTKHVDKEWRKMAKALAWAICDFLRALLYFPKVLVAGIQGECVGLGVTMLPLFDMVICSDNSTFRTPFAQFGCVAEGGFLLAAPYLTSHGLAEELYFTSRVLKADDAFRRGLITKLCWPEKYQSELNSMLVSIAAQSIQSIISSKRQLRQNTIKSTVATIDAHADALQVSWSSTECQILLKQFYT